MQSHLTHDHRISESGCVIRHSRGCRTARRSPGPYSHSSYKYNLLFSFKLQVFKFWHHILTGGQATALASLRTIAGCRNPAAGFRQQLLDSSSYISVEFQQLPGPAATVTSLDIDISPTYFACCLTVRAARVAASVWSASRPEHAP